ncbi:MAG: hypothetical protein ACSHW0_09220 [Thalassotalea sp.]
MYLTKHLSVFGNFCQKSSMMVFLSILLVTGCDSSSSDDDSEGGLRFYNISKNSPAIYLTVDEDLTDEDDDAFEKTYTGVSFTAISAYTSIGTGEYAYEIAYQSDDSKSREDLSIINEGSINIINESTQLMVLSAGVNDPVVTVFDIPLIDDDIDDDDDLFNLRLLNMVGANDVVNLYVSKDDETFNEAQLIGQLNEGVLSDNVKYEQDTYIFYITDPETGEVIFQSDEVIFAYASQYIIVVRENTAAGDSPYVIDRISNSAVTEYIDVQTESNLRVFNAVEQHYLVPDYTGDLSLKFTSIENSVAIDSLSFGEFSTTQQQQSGDYTIDLTIAGTEQYLLANHLFTLPQNTDKTVFFYLEEENIDDDNDGDFDENNDGIIDEVEVNIHSLIVENSNNQSIYDHQIKIINLIDNDDFDYVQVYFVKSNELIDTASYKTIAAYAKNTNITLLNNTYKAYVVAKSGSSDIILNSFELTLNEESTEQFMILQTDETAPSGYRVSISAQ